MKINKYILAVFLMFTTSNLFAEVSISYGEGQNKADYINNNKYPKIDDPMPTGPLSFRVVDDKIWVADSVGNKLMQFNKKGKFISEFSILPDGMKPYNIDEYNLPILNMLIDDFAPVRGDYGKIQAWWIADSCKNKLYKFSVDGKKLAEISNPEFGQLFRVEVGLGGHIFVADKAARAIFTYDSEGKLLNRQVWEWSGMAVSGNDDVLYRLMYDNEAHKNVLVISTIDGKTVSGKLLDIDMFDPRLWWVDESKGECVITYSPAEFKGFYNIVRVGLDGKVKASGELPAPIIMNRYIDHLDYDEVFIGKCNFFKAPEGKFEVIPFKLPE